MKRKGFTLIELIVVMAIIAILVLFGAPKYLEYVGEAKVTSIKTNIKELETASATYFMRRNELPILAGETLTSEQIQGETYDKTGVVEEVLDGTYSNIDYFKIKNYLKAPKESEKYILHESGKVYYLSSGVSLAESMEDYFLVTPEGVLTGLSETYKALGNEAPKDLVIPQVINGITVTSIGDGAFLKMPLDTLDAIEWNITSIKLPSTIITISDRAFGFMYSLSEITIPYGVTSIGDYAFINCESLISITIPDSVTTIGNSTFSTCISLRDVELSKNLTTIGEAAFSGCSSLTNITIPDSVTIIENNVFGYCTSLENIVLSENLTTIGDYAFENCYSLTNITIPLSVTTIKNYAFSEWLSNQTITVYGSGKTYGTSWSGGATVVYK